jgi:SAM-dependent methyltransferase
MASTRHLEFYNSKARLGAEAGSDGRVQPILSLIGKSGSVLEIGPGYGAISAELKRLGNAVTGLDVTNRSAEFLRALDIPCIIYQGEEPFPFDNGSFDAVLASEVVEHVFDTRGFVCEALRVLRPNGLFVLTTPNLASLGCRLGLLVGKLPWPVEWNADAGTAGHIRAFTAREIRSLLIGAGFESVTIRSTRSQITPRLLVPAIHRAFPTLGTTLIGVGRRALP